MLRHSLGLYRGFRSTAAILQAAESTKRPTVDHGAKAVLYSILNETSIPLNSAQIWEQAEKAGVKSKRHTKQLLQTMRKAGAIQTKPTGKGQNYVYALRTLPKKAEASSQTGP